MNLSASEACFETLSPRFQALFAPHIHVERLWTGARWCEGPAWFAAGRYLVWSDIPNNRMMRWDETDGSVSVFRSPSNNANGNTVDRQGRLITCEQGTRRVTRTEHDGSISVLAERFEGRRLNSPNDVVVHSDGSIWFTDPTYGILTDYEGDKAEPELAGCHVYRLSNSGDLTQVTDDFVKPNGLAFSPSEDALYISDSGATHDPEGPAHIRRFEVQADGTLRGGEIIAECQTGIFDGFRLDQEGRIWTSAFDGVHCYEPNGDLIGKIRIPEIVGNLTFGGPKRNRLFICGTTSLYSVYVFTRGVAIG
ncbi:SMP-30/gluconolactonase/LRE family protein [Frigidibacter sp. ROC022]|uniref:SMP-30/gluconolactonase/LRE family protein n=1 Tax=Frigidibacter sp. ROC022 TaxID=2971796 RepID=UPI00215B6254|nr:SMP-30/gluconolactonase/LRE family protein [Frigidibacter sp. ROC022]MCR8722775.1 SMP-30/gluconolactonase/LRE family protein [Frigidibacter sp. ROC022]